MSIPSLWYWCTDQVQGNWVEWGPQGISFLGVADVSGPSSLTSFPLLCMLFCFLLVCAGGLNSGLCAWATHPALFLLWLFWRQGLIFCPGWPGLWSSYTSCHCWDDRHASLLPVFFSVEMGSCKLLVWAGLE
jgi:hypothetical protein